jgi:hypothetical protein
MQIERLRSLIKESIQEYIKEIDEAAETAAMEARIAKCDEAISARETRLENLRNLEEAAGMLDEAKVKAMENEIKELKKAKAKFEKDKEKKAAKKAGKGKKEVTTDAKTEDTPVDESDVMEKMEMEGDMRNEEALNESFLKMQKLAGVITEAQYNQKKKALVENQEEVSPEEAAKAISQNIDKLKSDPKLDVIADKIADDPKAVEELNKMLAKFNISLNEGDADINPQDVYKIALAFAKKAKTLDEESNYGGAFLGGLFGGGALAHYIASMGDVITPYMKLMGYAPSHMTESVLGGLAAAALLVIAAHIKDKLKSK